MENVFCQQRGRNGQNDNPTYVQYGPSINSILLGQTTTTKKGNTGKVDNYAFHKPNKLPVQRNDSKKRPLMESKETEAAITRDVISDDVHNVCVFRESLPAGLHAFFFPSDISQSTLGGGGGGEEMVAMHAL